MNDDICINKKMFHDKQYIEELKKDGCYEMHMCTIL